MEEDILIKYYEIKKDFLPDDLKKAHYLDHTYKLQNSFSNENLDYIFDYLKNNWKHFKDIFFSIEGFKLFHNSNLELLDNLKIIISKELLFFTQYQIDRFINTFYTYYFKGNLLVDIAPQININKIISIAIKAILSSTKLSYHQFELTNTEIHEEILNEVLDQYLINIREINYLDFIDLLIKERNRIKNILQHDCLNGYIEELEILINFSSNIKNSIEEIKSSSNNKFLNEKQLNFLTENTLHWFYKSNLNEIKPFYNLNIDKELSLKIGIKTLSILFIELINLEYYSKIEIENLYDHKGFNHCDEKLIHKKAFQRHYSEYKHFVNKGHSHKILYLSRIKNYENIEKLISQIKTK